MNERRFTVKGTFEVTIDDVLDFLGMYGEDYDLDYEPTDEEWLECARYLWERDECAWVDSEVEEE